MQVEALKRYGVPPELIFTEKRSGSSMKRPEFLKAMKFAQRTGAEFVVWKLDRLGRTLIGIIETMEFLRRNKFRFVSLTERFDTESPFGKAMISLLAVFAQLERDLIVERTKAGLERARERGEVTGRPVAMTEDRIARAVELLAEGERGNVIWRELQKIEGPKISRSAYYAWQQLHDATDGQILEDD